MSDSRAIQRAGASLPAGRNGPGAQIMTPQGPAIIQVIDLPPSNLGPVLGGGGGGGSARPGGINILGAIARRWWLVLLVFAAIGGGGFVAAEKFMKPVYQARAELTYTLVAPNNTTVSTDPAAVVRKGVYMITAPSISLIAARNPDLQQAIPWLKDVDLTNPNAQKLVAMRLEGMVDADLEETNQVIGISTEKPDPIMAATLCNAYAAALVEYVQTSVKSVETGNMKTLREQRDKLLADLSLYNQQKAKLMVEKDVEGKKVEREALLKSIAELENKRAEALIKQIAAKAALERFEQAQGDPARNDAIREQKRRDLVEAERAKDGILQAAMKEHVAAYEAWIVALNAGMTPEHPTVKALVERLEKARQSVEKRDLEIQEIIRGKVFAAQRLADQANIEQLTQDIASTDAFLNLYKEQRAKYNSQLRDLVASQVMIEELDRRIAMTDDEYRTTWKDLQHLMMVPNGVNVPITIEKPAYVPELPSTDKRLKVQAAGCATGLFMGILLALLVDKFDKRLRHPRDIEPLMNAPVLGMIPRIQELKRIKGEQAKNLIAEEFRVIRTQLLFGNPQAHHKTICVSSPAPGDGKTSLAVNLAISIAKAGRRTLLVDADLRKPDVHRIFNIPDSPGLAELILNTCEPNAAIRKSDIEMLDVLPAGIPMIRPSELLSRPEMGRLLEALGELYDHIIFDSAPLLPVSDTHVLAGMVEAVVCSFSADVERDTVKMVEEILRRSHANLVGTVMNQVKFRHSNSYHRGKTAYDSYYNSPRATAAALAKVPQPQAEASAPQAETPADAT